ncbi:MAG: hypothetical protein KAU41_01590, partial [Deltaproteobacteria bacterium]|nr:hypothetical protein [Deltaproteobacteria bacterium]
YQILIKKSTYFRFRNSLALSVENSTVRSMQRSVSDAVFRRPFLPCTTKGNFWLLTIRTHHEI